jgi:hypothetical protein
MLLAGTSLCVFSVMGKIPGPPEEYWYRDLKKETSSSDNNNDDDDDDDENNSCYNYGIDEIPYLS